MAPIRAALSRDSLLRAVRVAAFSGLAISVFAVVTGNGWLLAPLTDAAPRSTGRGGGVDGVTFA